MAAGGAQPVATPAPLTPPKSLAGFFTWPEYKQVKAITALMNNAHLPSDVRDFLTGALKDNRLSSLVRNNMLNALENQEKVDPNLWTALTAIITIRNRTRNGVSSRFSTWGKCTRTATAEPWRRS